jgi:transposase
MRTLVMNSEMSAQHLRQILQTYPDKPILLFWDRAHWHRGPAVKQVLIENSRLEIMFFPVASPDLNPQEQVWKATRKAISHNHLEPRLPELAERFEHHLNSNNFASSFLHHYGYTALRPMFI